VRPLATSLNDLLARLQAAFATQRDFVADAAHELRTPLTALQLQAQLLERATDGGERDAALEELKRGLARAGHTVQQLLTLARQEPGAAALRREPVALSELVRDGVVAQMRLAEAQGIDLGVAEGDAVIVTGDVDALRILLGNLIGNAVRYTPRGGRVDVSCRLEDGQPVLAVADSGPGIPEAERERVFDRFYRRPGERTAGNESGAGLGLAIVRAIADRHLARVSLQDAALGGLCVRVTFPAPEIQE
jgi:two-component system OmpR family sensor kinase